MDAKSARTRKEKEIWEACEVIMQEKRHVTYLAIGEQLVKLGYKRGSNSDIRRYLKTWRKNHTPSPAPLQTPIAAAAPVELSVPLDSVVKSEESTFLSYMSFYQHHIEQFDRLLHIIELLKKENRLLRDKLTLASRTKLTQSVLKTASKPRIILPALLGEEYSV